MNLKELTIVIVLIILLILIILQIIKSRKNEHFDDSELLHNNTSCPFYPFPSDECSEEEYLLPIGDIHIDFNRDAIPLQSQNTRLHIVNPSNPCCLRTCINDFTYTKENTTDGINIDNIGKYKEYINKNLFFASKCDTCLNNYYVALKRLNSASQCDQDDETGGSQSSCSIQI